jgi:hypothetical protein
LLSIGYGKICVDTAAGKRIMWQIKKTLEKLVLNRIANMLNSLVVAW